MAGVPAARALAWAQWALFDQRSRITVTPMPPAVHTDTRPRLLAMEPDF